MNGRIAFTTDYSSPWSIEDECVYIATYRFVIFIHKILYSFLFYFSVYIRI